VAHFSRLGPIVSTDTLALESSDGVLVLASPGRGRQLRRLGLVGGLDSGGMRIDYSRPTVHRLIAERRLAPFYLGLQDYEDDWETVSTSWLLCCCWCCCEVDE
jgi:hypothetical protein